MATKNVYLLPEIRICFPRKKPFCKYALFATTHDLMKPAASLFQATRGGLFSPRHGFALIVTISLMVLLTIIAVGLLSLSAISLRSSRLDNLHRAARDNARLSLLLALGDLQRLTGPDQRITAPSSVLAEPKDTTNSSIAQPRLTGVWKGWKWDENGTPDYDSRKNSDFLGWLVSHPDHKTTKQKNYAENEPDSDAIRLVGMGTVGNERDQVRALAIPVGKGTTVEGRCAWAVLDESQKALVTLPESKAAELGEELAEMTAPAVPGFQSVSSGGRDWKALQALGDDRLKLITTGELPLGGVEHPDAAFHDLTASSVGLATNAAEGGLARDLSLLFDNASLPKEYRRRFLYSDGPRPLAMAPNRFRGAQPMPAPDPTWSLLHSHARLYTKVKNIETNPTIGTDVRKLPKPGTPPSRTLFDLAFTRQQIAPVIAKAQFIFSFGFGASPSQSRGQGQKGAGRGENWIIWLVTYPVVTLWNPYNVNLTFKSGRIDLYRVPLAFQIYRNGRAIASRPTLFANAYLKGDFSNRVKRYYRLNIKPPIGKNGRPEREIVMKPGEHLVLTAHSHVRHYRQEYMTKGVDLRPGWNAPAGKHSNFYVGGVSSLNLCVDSKGNNSGRINGISVRAIPVKAGDRIGIKVTPAHANVDKLDETNKKEVTAYLKYYIASGGRSASQPDLVGGIELDYGKREKKLLKSYSQRELPTLVVPRGIPPREKGDDYHGRKPPPSVRYQEPFLIATIYQKTALDVREPSRSWLQNAPTNLYASSGIDQKEAEAFQQYEFKWEPMTDWASSPTVEIDADNRGFGASGIYAQTGREIATFAEIPLAPLTSLAQLRHAPINSGGQLPLQTQVVANSFAHPLLAANEILRKASGGTYLDHSFLANQRLFDSYFFSSASTQSADVFGKGRTRRQVLEDFFSGKTPLPDSRMLPLLDGANPKEIAKKLDDPETNFKTMAAYLGIKGAFNVNSTSVAAWEAILASLQPDDPHVVLTATGDLKRTRGDGVLVTRQVPPVDKELDGVTDPLESSMRTWSGHRRLDDYQISQLAEEIVKQIKQRGPFQSLAEFVNRRVENGDLGLYGALEAAIENAHLNDKATAQAKPAGLNVNAPFPEAAQGTTADGAPAAINQADLLTQLAPLVTVRGDTFRIRAYGEARSGKEVARAWCEAIVQRMPAYVDPSDPPETSPETLDPGSVNARFGRRYKIVSFRWLSPEEV